MNGADRPAKVVPLLYFGTAYVSLVLACVLAAIWPRAVAGFFYHSWMVAIVHLITLGWITCSILGAIYIVGPVALRMPMPARRGDYIAFGLVVTGIIGMVAHFWIEEFGGMAWSAATVTVCALYVVRRVLAGLRRSSAPAGVKLHIGLACVNFVAAASAGILLGFDKVFHFLPGYVLSNVFAHAHLAALGWATMMVIGVAYRLLPMMLPSRMPTGRSVYASAILLEGGLLGLFIALVGQSRWTLFFAIVVASGLATFIGSVVWMLRSPALKPAGAPRVDFAVLHAAGAGVSLLVAIGLGLTLVVMPPSSSSLRVAAAYGVFGLLGFLAQMVVGMEARLLPLAAWFWVRAGDAPSPHSMRDRTLQAIVFFGWTIGVPAVGAGMFLESPLLVGSGAWALFAAVAVATVDAIGVVTRRHTAQAPLRCRLAFIVSPPQTSARR
jgi:hypothetical protein